LVGGRQARRQNSRWLERRNPQQDLSLRSGLALHNNSLTTASIGAGKILIRRTTRPDECADRKIEKYDSHHQINYKMLVFWSDSPVIAHAPETLGKK
jgi:hypothetical protein